MHDEQKTRAMLLDELRAARVKIADLEGPDDGIRRPLDTECASELASTRIIFDNTHDAIIRHDLEGNIVEVNQTTLDMFEVTRAQALALTITDISGPEMSADVARESWNRALRGEEVVFEWLAMRPNDRSRFNVEVALKKVTINDGDYILGNVRDITRTKQIEAELLRSREHQRLLLDNIQTQVWFLTDDHTYGAVNRAHAEFNGVAVEDIVCRDMREVFSGDTLDMWRSDNEAVFTTGQRSRAERWIPGATGERRLLSIVKSPRLGDDGDVEVVVCSAEDITERRRAEERFRELTDLLPETVFEADNGLKLTYTNRRGLEMFGFDDEDLVLGLNGLDLIQPAERDRAMENVARRLVGVDKGAVEYQARRRDGSAFPILLHMSPVVADGDVVGFRGVIFDITEQKRADAALRESEERLQTLFRSSADYLMLLDREHRIRMINKVDPSLTEGDVLGTPHYELVPPDDRERIKGVLDLVFLKAEQQQYSIHFARPDGSKIHYQSIAAPVIVSGKVTGSVVSSRDVTEQIRLEKEKDQLQEQYRHSQKMEAIGRLAGGVAHDFNNILCAIMGNSTLALDDLSAGDPLRGSIGEISKAADRAADLTRQLLAFSRKQVIAPRVVDLSHLITRLHPMLVRLIGEDIILRTEPREGIGRIRVDPGQIEQVVLNLAVNARDAMPDGGALLIETRDVALDEEYCETHANATPGAHVMLAVRDTGCGMSDEVREKIFEPFFTTKELGQGTGLGLATVFGIVEQSEGRIEVRSELSSGTSFELYFPRVFDEADELTRRGADDLILGQETLLVVEDDEIVRNLAMKLLTRLGYTVLIASSGEDALSQELRHEGAIDLLLTDVVMPHMNGRQLADQITSRRPGIKVLYSSGYSHDVIANHGVLDEGVQFLSKPYTIHTLAARVREVLDQAD